jgi:hypothetical protein
MPQERALRRNSCHVRPPVEQRSQTEIQMEEDEARKLYYMMLWVTEDCRLRSWKQLPEEERRRWRSYASLRLTVNAARTNLEEGQS